MKAVSLRRYLDLLVETLDDDIGGDEIARRAFLSRFHFDRLLREAVGEAPGGLRRRLLLERAAYRLGHGDASATDIGIEAGYDSLGAFTRAFSRAFGGPPSAYRAQPQPTYWISSPNGVHFHPPQMISMPTNMRRNVMDLTERLIAHDLWLTARLLDHASTLPGASLDRTLDLGQTDVAELGTTSLRALLDRLVFTKETWTASMTGRPFEDGREMSLSAIKQRLSKIGPEFVALVRGIRQRGDWDHAFIDALCEPPETFTYGGAIAHVITFSAHRRELAVGALRSFGVTDIGYGDPIEWERERLNPR